MFRLFARAASPTAPRPPLRRAGLCAAALVLVWLALRLMPAPTSPAEASPVYSDTAGTVAVDTSSAPRASLSPGLLAALALLAGGVGLAVFLRQRRGGGASAGAFIEPLESCTLAPGQQLRLVRCGDAVLLLGVTGSQITLLKTFAAEDAPANEARENRAGDGSFAALLQHAGISFGGPTAGAS